MFDIGTKEIVIIAIKSIFSLLSKIMTCFRTGIHPNSEQCNSPIANFTPPQIQEEMTMKLFNAKKVMTGDCIWEKLRTGERKSACNALKSYQMTCSRFPVVNSQRVVTRSLKKD